MTLEENQRKAEALLATRRTLVQCGACGSGWAPNHIASHLSGRCPNPECVNASHYGSTIRWVEYPEPLQLAYFHPGVMPSHEEMQGTERSAWREMVGWPNGRREWFWVTDAPWQTGPSPSAVSTTVDVAHFRGETRQRVERRLRREADRMASQAGCKTDWFEVEFVHYHEPGFHEPHGAISRARVWLLPPAAAC